MTTKQKMAFAIHTGMTAEQINEIANELSRTPEGRTIAGKAISKGKRNITAKDRFRRAERMRDIGMANARKEKQRDIK